MYLVIMPKNYLHLRIICYDALMKTVVGSGEVPVIYTAHHASHDYDRFANRVALTPEQQIRFSDYGTDVTVPINGLFI